MRRGLLGEAGFRGLLFLIAAVVFCWPVLSVPSPRWTEGRSLLLFLSWGVVIGALFLISRRLE